MKVKELGTETVELTDLELKSVSGGAMSDGEFALFMGQVSAWAKEQGSKPVRLPGL
jgi:hypothetical protein